MGRAGRKHAYLHRPAADRREHRLERGEGSAGGVPDLRRRQHHVYGAQQPGVPRLRRAPRQERAEPAICDRLHQGQPVDGDGHASGQRRPEFHHATDHDVLVRPRQRVEQHGLRAGRLGIRAEQSDVLRRGPGVPQRDLDRRAGLRPGSGPGAAGQRSHGPGAAPARRDGGARGPGDPRLSRPAAAGDAGQPASERHGPYGGWPADRDGRTAAPAAGGQQQRQPAAAGSRLHRQSG